MRGNMYCGRNYPRGKVLDIQTRKESLGCRLAREYEAESRSFQNAFKIMRLWAPRLGMRVQGGLKRNDLRRSGCWGLILSFDEIEIEYFVLNKNLSQHFAATRTAPERGIQNRLRSHTRLMQRHSVWIGPVNADFFFPQIQSNLMRGLVIESDGSIHNHLEKMKKDEYKRDAMRELKIGFTSIPNFDLHKKTVQSLLQNLNGHVAKDSRSRARVQKRVYLLTLFSWLSYDDIDVLFNVTRGTTKSLVQNKNV